MEEVSKMNKPIATDLGLISSMKITQAVVGLRMLNLTLVLLAL